MKKFILLAFLYLSGTVPDRGFYIVDGQFIVIQKMSQLKVLFKKHNVVVVRAL